jgi:ABC-type transport system substrate-binding protein
LLIPSHIADRTADTPGYKLLGQPSGLRYQMELNVSRKILADVRVRQALRLATDRKALLQKVENGHGYLDESVIGPLSPNALVIPPLP